YCIHDMTWADIISQCEQDPTVFEDCYENGCTKAVELTPNGTLFNMTTVSGAQNYTGDGVSTLYYLVNYGADPNPYYLRWNYSYTNATASDPANVYSRSRIRTTLNGDSSNIDDWLAEGSHNNYYYNEDYPLLNESNCLFSCFPTELQSAIVPRETVNSNASYSSTANDETTYDKLFLLSLKEVGFTSTNVPNDDSGGEAYFSNMSATDREAYEFSNANASSTQTRTWWTRSRDGSGNYYAFEVMTAGTSYAGAVTMNQGLSPAFCIVGLESAEPEVTDVTVSVGESTGSYTKTYDGEEVTLTATATTDPEDAEVTYQWIDPEGNVIEDENTNTLTLTGNVADSGTYHCVVSATEGESSKTGEITITIEKATQDISYATTAVTKYIYDDPFTNELTKNTVFGDITYSIALDETLGGDLEVTIDETSGEVTIHSGSGTAIVTATAEGSDNYDEATVTYTLTVNTDEITWEIKVDGDSVEYDEDTGEYIDKITYTGSDLTLTMAVTLDDEETAHESSITYQWYVYDSETSSYNIITGAEDAAYTLTGDAVNVGDYIYMCVAVVTYNNENTHTVYSPIDITISKADQKIVFNEDSVEKETNDAPFTNALNEDESVVKGDVTYVSGDTSVATVDETTGEVTIVGVGTTTITATAAATDNYNSVEASYTLTVTKPATVNYAVKIYGIQADKYLEEDGETTGIAGLTFGPATGTSYLSTYKSCDSEYCIHNMSWGDIIAQSEEDPSVFKRCLENGCTKAVELTPNGELFDMTVVNNAAAQNYTGDGVSTLYYLLSADATNRYGYWNLSGGYGTPDSDPANVYSRSRIRTTLTGDRSNIDTWLAADSSHTNYYYSDTYPLLDESYSLFSCFPSELQEAIVSRETVSGGRGVNTGHTYPDTSYDKLWLFSLAEVGISSDYDDAGGTDYGTAKENSDRIVYEFSSANATASGGCAWWTRSRHSNSTYNMWDITESGGSSSRYCYYQYGISPGFCLAGPEVEEPEVIDITVDATAEGTGLDADNTKTYDGEKVTLTASATVSPDDATVSFAWSKDCSLYTS
ncbi:MAG: immunoglobulin domain-containing protein, partial [Bacteroidales bacterium]|nr:immunoglobulin domain-containing protein [Bacteroidales bacterium]